jgi:sugar phosphate isomerase/epimerase
MRIVDFPSGSGLDLTYCGNVHAPDSLATLRENLERFAGPLARRLAPKPDADPAACGLYFGATLSAELRQSPDQRAALARALEAEGLYALTVNAFPYGDFHAQRVKHAVYAPDWTQPERLAYTLEVAEILAALPHAGRDLSISTLPGAYGKLEGEARRATIRNLGAAALGLADIEARTGACIRLAIEPEPGCAFERIDPLLDFFEAELLVGPDAARRRRHLGVCLDVCHQAVEFEDLPTCLDAIVDRGVALPKIQVSSAIALVEPNRTPGALEALAHFDEARYLHQVFARDASGQLSYFDDLGEYLAAAPGRADLEVRCHFHVPVHREHYGALGTTQTQLSALLRRVRERELATQLEVETYTWDVLPREDAEAEVSLLDDLEHELRWVISQL